MNLRISQKHVTYIFSVLVTLVIVTGLVKWYYINESLNEITKPQKYTLYVSNVLF